MSRGGGKNGGPPSHSNSRHNRDQREESREEQQETDQASGAEGGASADDPEPSGDVRVFTYSENGLAYTVRVFEDETGAIQAQITMDEGSMNANAIYWSSEDYDGPSTNLGGPLNMNGGGSRFEGDRIAWEDAVELSQPGLGQQDPDNPTFLNEGDSLTFELEGAESIEDIDLLGIRATSVNGGDSIKGVSGNPETEPEPDPDPDPAIYDKVSFAIALNDDGFPQPGNNIFLEELLAQGPEGATGTFADYVEYVSDEGVSPPLEDITAVIFWQEDEDGVLEEVFRFDAPGDGDTTADNLLDAYDIAIAGLQAESADMESMFIGAVLSDTEMSELDDEDEDDVELIG